MISFYPRLRAYLNEEDTTPRVTNEQINAIKIEDLDVVYGSDGKPIDMKNLLFEIESARTAIASQSPYYAPYLHQMVPIFTWLVPTMATDGVRLFINPEFANSISWDGKIFVILHEIMHCVMMHQERGVGYDRDKFNRAADYQVNTLIEDLQPNWSSKVKTKDLIKELDGLFDEKYLNWDVDAIYKDLPDMPKSSNKKPQPGPPQPIKIVPGMKVRIADSKEVGIVTKVNSDNTYEIEPWSAQLAKKYAAANFVQENFYPRLLESLSTKKIYKRDEFWPILPPSQAPQGKGSGSGEKVEIEGQMPKGGQGSGEKKPGGQNEGGLGDASGEVMREQLAKLDGGKCGGVLTVEQGEAIARASGYDPTEAKEGKTNKGVWENNGRKMLADLAKIGGHQGGAKQAGAGTGAALYKALGRMYKSTIDWKRVLRNYIADALSLETESRIGNKKYLNRSDFPLRYGSKFKEDMLHRAILCVDVSGSMSDTTLQRIADEIVGLLFARDIEEVLIISFDDAVVFPIQRITQKQRKIEFAVTHMGTNFQRPLDYIKEKYKDELSVCIFLTDGGAPDPKRPIYFKKFIWIVYDNQDYVQPFGRLIKSMKEDM